MAGGIVMKTVCTLLSLVCVVAIAQAQCKKSVFCGSSYSQNIGLAGISSRSSSRTPTSGQSSGTSDGPPLSPPPSGIVVIPQRGAMWPDMEFPELPAQPPDYKKLLDKNGPQFANVFSMSSFSVLGYAKGGWPIVIDYQQQQESFALVTVSTDGIDPFYYRLRASDRAGHFQEVVHLPQRFGDKPVIAHYSVQALSMNAGEVNPTNFLILGLGAGDKAVASVGIDRVDFGPKAIHPPQNEKASYTFHSEFDFPEVEAGVLRVGLLKAKLSPRELVRTTLRTVFAKILRSARTGMVSAVASLAPVSTFCKCAHGEVIRMAGTGLRHGLRRSWRCFHDTPSPVSPHPTRMAEETLVQPAF
jgi:hypothetical protein